MCGPPCSMKTSKRSSTVKHHQRKSVMINQGSIERITHVIIKCTKDKNRDNALRVHAYLRRSGLDTHNSLTDFLVPMLADVGCLKDAQIVFDRLVSRNQYSWNALLCAYIKCGEPRRALELYNTLQQECVQVFPPVYVALLQSCASLKDVDRGRAIHAEINREGRAEKDLYIVSTLVGMYAKCGLLKEAQEAFDRCCNRNVVLWNALIVAYADHEQGRKALLCFEQMQKEMIPPTSITLTSILKACACAGAQERGQKVHDEIERRGLLEKDLVLGNAVVDMYAKNGLFSEAQKMFNKLEVTDVISWTALIAGYVKYEHAEDALIYLKQMEHAGISPNEITYACGLKACACIEATQKGQIIHIETVMKGLDLLLTSPLVDMYLECGLLAEARQEFDKFEVHDELLWNGLVSGHKFKLLRTDVT